MKKTGKDWEVIDFAYAFPLGTDPEFSGASLAFTMPEPRNEESRIMTTLACTSGDHEGMVVRNDYLRWAKEPTFEDNHDQVTKRHDQMEGYLRTLRETLPENETLLIEGQDGGYDLYIWENEDEERLSDGTKFIEVARQIDEALPRVGMVATLAYGHPLSMVAEPSSASDPWNDHRYPIPQGQSFASERDFDVAQRLCTLDPRIRLDCRHKQDGIQLSIECRQLHDEDGDATDSLEGSRTGKPTPEEKPKGMVIY